MTSYPVGQTWVFDIGEAQIEQHFLSARTMHYKVLTGPRVGAEETVEVDIQLIRPSLFLVAWREQDGIIVVHVEDYEREEFYSRVAMPDHRLVCIKGKMRRLR